MFSLSIDSWTLVLTAISTGVVLLGVPIAIYNLRIITRTHHLQSLTKFMDDLSSTEKERLYLHREFDRNGDHSKLDRESENKIKQVINSLNRIGMLIENKVLSPESVLSISHTVIIRCFYMLEPYINYKESEIGGRYGRRIRRLDERAKRFHDIRPHQRITKIKVQNKDGSYVIYETKIKSGCSGIMQRVVWRIKYILHIY